MLCGINNALVFMPLEARLINWRCKGLVTGNFYCGNK